MQELCNTRQQDCTRLCNNAESGHVADLQCDVHMQACCANRGGRQQTTSAHLVLHGGQNSVQAGGSLVFCLHAILDGVYAGAQAGHLGCKHLAANRQHISRAAWPEHMQ